ncbi:molybdopterin-guanine dinucleotide biosynthesis protein B [Desulfolucanica intricata]|uniref:molybdopterin-guanine dinucleotide biosynthesis protein B n=1 Tax=Desulfolucanica intricata TaxID=1285191 RepID=UPI000A90345C|nr:molybdopterin-guanine dinucleotide biosynthesis protein B [Desulfolucanica intricata]
MSTKRPPVIAVWGTSNTGKTTFLQKLIAEMKNRGFRVGTIKHTHHEVEIDQPGKDTWLHARAGAEAVVLASPGKLTLLKSVSGDPALEQAVELHKDMDLILVEGYKKAKIPKIAILRRGIAEKPISWTEDLIAVVSDFNFAAAVPVYGPDNAGGVADLIEEKYLK